MQLKIKDLAETAIMTALIIILGFFPPIPLGFLPVPIVIQNLGIMLAGVILGAKKGTISVTLFLLMVLLGMPFLTGQTGGLSAFCSPSGGYLIAWLFTPFLIGWLLDHFKIHHFSMTLVIIWLVGVFLLDGFGAVFLAFYTHASIKATLIANLVFFPGDTLKALIASFIGPKIRKALHTY